MTVAWEEYGFCSRCVSPVDEHHATCPENPLGVAGRIDIHKMLIEESRPIARKRDDEWATPMSVLDFATMVIHERLFRLTVPCIHCGRETTIPCQVCDHPQGVHRHHDGVCILFPVCPCESFQKPMVCAMPCRDHRMVPEELVDAALTEIPELGAIWDNDAREAIREGLFAVERVAQMGLEVEGGS